MTDSPAVSAVIICYNDEARLPSAIRSAQRQTLSDIEIIVVDHGSTDSSAAVAHAFAAEDPRIRVVELGDNEGKPGRPINAGIAAASAPWVVVLGSDDVFRRRGLAALRDAGEEADADLVIGGVRRVDMDTREATRWMPGVTLRSRVVTDVAQFPEMIRDTIGGGKLYRTEFLRDNGLAFPEDIFYQDQVFTIACFSMARTVAVQSKFIMDWRHWHATDRKSVTQRKTTVENLTDRFEANRRIDAFLSEHDRTDLLLVKQRKFLTHDLGIHIKDVQEASADYRSLLVELSRDYCTDLPEAAFEGLPLNKWFMVRCLLAGRLEDAEKAAASHFVQMLTEWEWLSTDEGTFLLPPWRAAQADPVFAVDRFRFDEVPPRLLPARGWAAVSREGDGFEFRITVSSPGRSELDSAAGVLLLRNPRTGETSTLPLGLPLRSDGLRRNWRLSASPRQLDRAFGFGEESVELHVAFHLGLPERWSIRLRPVPEQPTVADDQGWSVALPAEQEIVLTRRPRQGYRESLNERADRVRYRNEPKRDPDEELTLDQARDYLSDHRSKPKAKHVFFESSAGRLVAGGPLAVSRQLNLHRPKTRQHWSCGTFSLPEVPQYAHATRRFTRGYVDRLAQSAVWFDNGWLPFDPDGRMLVQLWHGVPLTRIEPPEEQVRWTHLVSSGDYFTQVMREAFGQGPELIASGSPFTDILVAPEAHKRRSQLRAAWGIADRTVAMYLPSLRPGQVAPQYRRPDLAAVAAALGPDYFWLFREHDDDVGGRRMVALPEDLRWFVGPINSRTDLADYILMSDVLVSDYSSVIVDFGWTGRPVIHYAPDRDFFERRDPGTYFSLTDMAAGPVVTDDSELVEQIKALRGNLSGAESRGFSEELAPWDGRASAKALLTELGL